MLIGKINGCGFSKITLYGYDININGDYLLVNERKLSVKGKPLKRVRVSKA